MNIYVKNVDELTRAQDLESWNRKRTNEELRNFVTQRLGRVALDNI